MPELVVNVIGATSDATELAFGNVIGSNIANLALVLGVAALISPIDIQGQLVRRELPLLLLAMAVLSVMSLDMYFDGSVAKIGRSDAVILLLIFSIFLYIMIMDFIRTRSSEPFLQNIDESPMVPTAGQGTTGIASLLFIAGGIALLYFGGEMTVQNSVQLADQLGISTAIVGMFIVAIGTSAPELVTSIIAAARNESDLALGNIVGSNLFNTLFVLPISATINPVSIPEGGVSDLFLSLLLAASLIPIFVLGRARLGRFIGVIFLMTYLTWLTLRVLYE